MEKNGWSASPNRGSEHLILSKKRRKGRIYNPLLSCFVDLGLQGVDQAYTTFQD